MIAEVASLTNERNKTKDALIDHQMQLARLQSNFVDMKEEFEEERKDFIDTTSQNDHTISHQLKIIEELKAVSSVEFAYDEPALREVTRLLKAHAGNRGTLEETPKHEQPSFGPSTRAQEFNIADTPPAAKVAGGNSSAPRVFREPPSTLTGENPQETFKASGSFRRPTFFLCFPEPVLRPPPLILYG